MKNNIALFGIHFPGYFSYFKKISSTISLGTFLGRLGIWGPHSGRKIWIRSNGIWKNGVSNDQPSKNWGIPYIVPSLIIEIIFLRDGTIVYLMCISKNISVNEGLLLVSKFSLNSIDCQLTCPLTSPITSWISRN